MYCLKTGWLILFALMFEQNALGTKEIEIEELTTPKGLTSWFTKIPNTEIVSISFIFKDFLGHPPETLILAAEMLAEGPKDMEKKYFITKSKKLGFSPSFIVTISTFCGCFTVPSRHLEEALSLFSHIFHNPKLSPDSLQRCVDQRVTDILQELKSPSARASKAFPQLIFPDTPYAPIATGRIEALKNTRLQDIESFIKEDLSRDRLIIGLTGNLSGEQAAQVIDKIFGDFPASHPLQERKLYPAKLDGILYVFDHKGTSQSTVLFAHPGIKSSDPDYFKSLLLECILNNPFTQAGLCQTLRERKGFIYSISLTRESRQYTPDLWKGSFSASNDKISEALQEIKTLWRELKANGVSQEDLNLVKNYLIGSYPFNFVTSSQISNLLVNIQDQGLPSTYPQDYCSLIQNVTLEELNTFTQKFLEPDKLTFIIVGQPTLDHKDGVIIRNPPLPYDEHE